MTRASQMPAEVTVHDSIVKRRGHQAERDQYTGAPQPEWRPAARSSVGGPETREDFRAAIEEMRANDHEWIEWQSAERLGDLHRGRVG